VLCPKFFLSPCVSLILSMFCTDCVTLNVCVVFGDYSQSHVKSHLFIYRFLQHRLFSKQLPSDNRKIIQQSLFPKEKKELCAVTLNNLRSIYTLYIQWGQKVFSQPLIVEVLLLRMMREVCNFHHRYTSTMRDKMRKKSRKSQCMIFEEFICKLWWKISIWSITKVQLNTL